MSIIQGTAIAAEGGYQIERSLRFNSADSAYLNRTPASAGNQKTWTWSAWIKPSRFASQQPIWTSFSSATNYGLMSFSASGFYDSEDTFKFMTTVSNVVQCRMITTAVYRDPSAWYHFVVAIDTTQATASNRIKIYVNGVQVTAFNTATYPAQNADIAFFNTTNPQQIGTSATGTYGYYAGYMTEVNFIDGQALDPTSFGEFNSDTGVWQPKAYTGTYGTNGFYLNFSDNSGTTATTLGKDYSGNGNNWTPNNFSVTAGAGNDSLVDTPTPYGVDTGAGGEVRGNYCTLNPLTLVGSGTGSVSNGNLTLTSPTTDSTGAQLAGTIAVSSDKYYFEGTFTTLTSASGYLCFGVQNATVTITGLSGSSRAVTNTWWISDDGNYRANGGSTTSSGLGSFSAGDVAMIAIDASTGKGWIGKNGTWVGNPAAGTGNTFSSLPAMIAPFAQAIRNTTTSSVINANFGQRPFQYTAPSGFKALCTTNLPEPAIEDGGEYFGVNLYSGTNANQTITNDGFSPDLVWIKARNASASHVLVDSVRGSNKVLNSNLTNAESTSNSGTGVTSFNSDGFSLGTNNSATGETNFSGSTYVAWQWRGSDSSAVSNTAGTITSTVSANTTSGFSIVTYTGNGVNGATVGHGLGVAPKLIIFKRRNGDAGWQIYHESIGNTQYLDFTTAAATTGGSNTLAWNATSPTSTLFSLGTATRVNGNTNTYVAYCFAPVANYSAFGSISANGAADNAFVYTGFLPRYVLLKRTDSTSNWIVWDTTRNTYNVLGAELYPNLSNAESTVTDLDFLSNGFKLRNASFTGTWIYAAFASSPFKYSLGF